MSRDTSDWSHDALVRYKHSIHHYDIMDRGDERAMAVGPQLDNDGYTLVIPAGRKFYRRDAAAFWRSKGFRWDPDDYQWTRDTRRSLQGKQYTPKAWLESARRKFYEFYPEMG